MVARLKPKSKPAPRAQSSQSSPVRGYSALRSSRPDLRVEAKLYWRTLDPPHDHCEVRRYYAGAIQIGFVRKPEGEPWELYLTDDQAEKTPQKYKTEEAMHARFRELLTT